MSRKPRRSFTPQQKVAILREHLLEKVPVSEVCDKHGLVPTVFYRWQKELFEVAPELLAHKNRKPVSDALARQNEALKAKLAHKDEVIAEIMADHIALKKELGEL
jgi:transposase-like protein